MQREVSRKLYAQLPELSQLLDRTLARAPKNEYGPPPASLWHRLVVSQPSPKSPPQAVPIGVAGCSRWRWPPPACFVHPHSGGPAA